MKKVVLSLAVLFSMAMVSCGGNKAEATADSDTMVVTDEAVEVAVDSANDSATVEAAAATDTVVAPVEEAK